MIGAGRGGRTPTTLRSADFESATSANSVIPARLATLYYRAAYRILMSSFFEGKNLLASFGHRLFFRRPQKTFCHRFAPIQNFVIYQLFHRILIVVCRRVRIAHRHLYCTMSHQLRNWADAHALHHQPRGKGEPVAVPCLVFDLRHVDRRLKPGARFATRGCPCV